MSRYKLLALIIPVLALIPITIAYATVEDTAPEPEAETEELTTLKDINNKLRKVVKATEIQENFFVAYTVTDLVLSCTDDSHRNKIYLTHHVPAHHDHNNALVWYDKLPQSGELMVKSGSYSGAAFHVLDINVQDGGYFTGRGLLHTNDQVCPDTAMMFEFDIRGECDGSSFSWTTNNPNGFNATASGDGYHAVCLER